MKAAGKISAVLLGILVLDACSALPSQGPSTLDVIKESNYEGQDAPPRYLVTELDPRAAAIVAKEPDASLFATFGSRGGPSSPIIGLGDTVSVTVWEAAAGGLFSSATISGVTAGSHSASIPEQVVDRNGTIAVPFAGRIHIAGGTTADAERKIVDNLKGKAIEPQALVTVPKSVSNSVTVTGEVTTGSRVPISGQGDRILDVIATTGGIRVSVPEAFITLSRGNRTARVPMQTMLQRPQENIYVRPKDVLTVVREPQTFTAFGATGRNALVPFDAMGITLEEAVAKAGGLLDSQADPQGVFLLRPEPVAIAREIDPAYPIQPGARFVNVVYRVNLKNTATFFVARKFAVHNKDMIYIASAPAMEFYKAMQLFSTAVSPGITGAAIAIK
jgi:polysaccharide export outer membrane protein